MKDRHRARKINAHNQDRNRPRSTLTTNVNPQAYLEFEEGAALENAATNLRDQWLTRTLRFTGCRITEALGLTVDNIDFINQTICIKHLKARIRLSCPRCGVRLSRTAALCSGCGQPVAGAVATQREQTRQRVIPIDPGTLDLFQYFIQHGGPVERNGRK